MAYSSEEGPLSKSQKYEEMVEICVGESLKVENDPDSNRAEFAWASP